MSAQVSDPGPVAGRHVDVQAADSTAPAEHPRGAGFRILSRMARRRDHDPAPDPAYEPRHRLDDESR
jgi:hypothetical protein